MKKMNKHTFVLNMLKDVSGINTTSLIKFASLKDERVNEVLFYYLSNFESKIYDENLLKIKLAVINSLNDKENKIIKKYDKFWNNYCDQDNLKYEVIQRMNNLLQNLSIACNKVNVNYGNAYKFFVKKDISALKLEKALELSIALQECNKEKIVI